MEDNSLSKQILLILKDYALQLSYPKIKIGSNKSIQEYFDEGFTSQYVNGYWFINENPISVNQLSFDWGVICWIDTGGMNGNNVNEYIIETTMDYGDLWERMDWYVDDESITPEEIIDGNLHVLKFGDLSNSNSLKLKVDSYMENDVQYIGFVNEYIHKFKEY